MTRFDEMLAWTSKLRTAYNSENMDPIYFHSLKRNLNNWGSIFSG